MIYKKGRGAQQEINNQFNQHHKEREYTDLDLEEIQSKPKTEFIEVFPKTIVNKVNSPDMPYKYSMNPYQGCEHGCIYCYARNSHEYWGYGAGLDFEQKILIKRNAPELLATQLQRKHWVASPILLSGNTDCYQPIERKEQLTRKCLETLYNFRHPVSIITKNAMITRDIDLLKELNKHNLVHTTITITSLQEEIRQKVEPRTATAKQKLNAISLMAKEGIPVNLMMGPIIPGLNNYEIFDLAKAAADHGARNMVFTVVRLNGHLGQLFTDWVHKAFPQKADKILSLIRQTHNGQLNDSRYGIRMRGEGEIASMIHQQIRIAREQFFNNTEHHELNCDLHAFHKTSQLNLFS